MLRAKAASIGANKMFRRGQSGLEYVYILAIMAAAIIAMLVYIKRGFQGNLRSQAEQIGSSGSYSAGNTVGHNVEDKRLESEIVSTTTTTTTYGNAHWPGQEIADLKEEAKTLKKDLWELRVKANALKEKIKYKGFSASDPQLSGLRQEIEGLWQKTKDLEKRIEDLKSGIALLKNKQSELEYQIQVLEYAYYDDPQEREKERARLTGELESVTQQLESDKAALKKAKANLKKAYKSLQDKESSVEKKIKELSKEPGSSTTPAELLAAADDLAEKNKEISEKQDALNNVQKELTALWKEWESAPKEPDLTTSTSSNTETGTQTQERSVSESLGTFSGDKWQK